MLNKIAHVHVTILVLYYNIQYACVGACAIPPAPQKRLTTCPNCPARAASAPASLHPALQEEHPFGSLQTRLTQRQGCTYPTPRVANALALTTKLRFCKINSPTSQAYTLMRSLLAIVFSIFFCVTLANIFSRILLLRKKKVLHPRKNAPLEGLMARSEWLRGSPDRAMLRRRYVCSVSISNNQLNHEKNCLSSR